MKKSQALYSRGYLPRRQAGRPRRKIIIFLWILFLILIFAYIFLFSPIFKIKEIKISGNRALSSEEIKSSLDKFLSQKILIFFDHNNIFLATGKKLTNIIINDFPRILSLETNKDIFKKTIDLEIVERKEAGIFCRQDCYYIDKDGVIFEKAPQTSGTLILTIKDNSESEAEIGKNVIDKEFMAELIFLKDDLLNQLGLKVIDFIIEADTPKDLRVDTNEEWYILFDRTRDLGVQFQALVLVLEEKIKEGRKSLEYVDLRIENRVYYK